MFVWSLGREDPLEEGMANHSSIFDWRISHAEEPVRLRSMGLQRAGYNWSDLARRHVPSLPLFFPSSPLGGAVPLGQVLANKSRRKGAIRLALWSASSFSCSGLWSHIFYHSPSKGLQWRGLLTFLHVSFPLSSLQQPWPHTRKPKAGPLPTRWPRAAFLSIIHRPAPQSAEQ